MDGSKARGAKIFSLDQSELWIEALVQGEEGLSASDPISFRASAIDFVRGLGPRASIIRLNAGVEIAVALPQEVLLEKLQNPQDAVLDLKAVSYLEKKAVLLDRLRVDFQREAEAARYASLESLTFQAWVRPSNKAEFREFTFRGADVQMREISEGESIMGGRNIRLKMKEGIPGPFEGPEFIIEGVLQEFRAMCDETHVTGRTELDLRDYSIKKGKAPQQEASAPSPRRRIPRP